MTLPNAISDKKYITFWLLALLLLIVASYSHTLYSPITLDDKSAFIEAEYVHLEEVVLENILELSKSPFGLRRFIPILTFAIDNKIGNGRIEQYHITNISIHLLCTLFVYLFSYNILRTVKNNNKKSCEIPSHIFSFAVAALWSLNPVQTNAVTYLVQRMASLAALGYLSSLTFYMLGRENKHTGKNFLYLTASALCATFSFFSKENSYTLPLTILLLELFIIKKIHFREIINNIPSKLWLLTAFIIIAISPIITDTTKHFILNDYIERDFTPIERLMTESRVLVHYITLLLAPIPSRLNLDYDFSISRSLLDPPSTIICLLLLILTVGLTAISVKKELYKIPAFGIVFFFITILPESSIISLEIIFEHRLYLPSVGFFIFICWMISLALNKTRETNPTVVPCTYFLIFIILLASSSSLLTSIRNNKWASALSINHDCVTKSPNKPRTHINYGIALDRIGKVDKSIEEFNTALALTKKGANFYALNNLMVAYIKKGEFDKSIETGKEYVPALATAYTPSNSLAISKFLYNLSFSYFKTGQIRQSINILELAISLGGHYPFIANEMEHILETIIRDSYPEKNTDRDKSIVYGKMAKLFFNSKNYHLANFYISKSLGYDYINEESLSTQQAIKREEDTNKSYMLIEKSIKDRVDSDTILNVSLLLIQATIKHYPFAKIFAFKLLEKITNGLEPNAYIDYLKINWKLKYLSLTDLEIEQEIDRYVTLHGFTFSPFLETLSEYFLAKKDISTSSKYSKKILEIYPGHPQWTKYKRIASLEETTSKIINDGK